ncbi:hypothetical protein AB0H77_06070 [Streptomyces sp. NPDC050844]|uniref:hypothetical protein n=1 Tax=Streptomyces sp. NPDC050844 TaxID=3155790 RepID=UPI003407298A
MTDQLPRRFTLVRDIDETGVSGVGVIVEGLEFTDGTVALRWLTDTTSTAIYASTADVETIHGHGGKTRIEWIDDHPEPSAWTADDWKQTAAVNGALYRSAETTVTRVMELAERWRYVQDRQPALAELRAALQPPAHDGPTVPEAAAADRNWDLEKGGE